MPITPGPYAERSSVNKKVFDNHLPLLFRRSILFAVELSILYFLIWAPWRQNLAKSLLFFGSGMLQVAAIYATEWNPAATPRLFTNSFMRLLAALLGLSTVVIELAVGFGSKPWWQAVLLPIPPFVLASVWYKSRNPSPPFFAGILSAVLALLGYLATR